MRISRVLGLLTACVLPSALWGQAHCPALPTGSTVRLQTTSTATYTLPQAVHPSDTAIFVSTAAAGRVAVRCAELERVQLRVGRGSRTRSALKGAGIGLLIGGVAGGGLAYASYGEEEDGGWQIFSRGEGVLLGTAFFGGLGAVAGGVTGFVSPGSRWEDVPLASPPPRASAEGLRIAPAEGAGVRVSYTLSF